MQLAHLLLIAVCGLALGTTGDAAAAPKPSLLDTFAHFFSLFLKFPDKFASPFGVYMFIMIGVMATALGALYTLHSSSVVSSTRLRKMTSTLLVSQMAKSPQLREDRGLHDRVALARRRSKPRVRTENLLAGALVVPIAILGG